MESIYRTLYKGRGIQGIKTALYYIKGAENRDYYGKEY